MTASNKQDNTENENTVSSRFDEAFPQDPPINETQTQDAALRAENEKLKVALQEAEEKMAAYWDRLVRGEADRQNDLKRGLEEQKKRVEFANKKFAIELLEVRDSLEQGLTFAQNEKASVEQLVEGMALTKSVLLNVMDKEGIKEIVPVIGEAFNPTYHEALSMQETAEYESNKVVVVIQKGYTLHNQLLRPARVVVSKASVEK